MKTIAFCNQKGGVGKSSGCVNTAHAFYLMGLPVLVVDLDPNGSSTVVFYNPKNHQERQNQYTLTDVLEDKNFDPFLAIYDAYICDERINNEIKSDARLYILPCDISLAIYQATLSGKMHKEKYLKRQLDKCVRYPGYKDLIVLIDLPSTLCDLSINGAYAADLLVILTPYESDGLRGIKGFFNIVMEAKESQDFDYYFLRNKLDNRMSIAVDFMEKQLIDFESKLFKTIIRSDQTINNAKSENKTVFAYDPKSKSAEDYMNFAKELKEILDEK